MAVLKYVLLTLCLSGCLCQRDCTGTDCPVLNNCIEEVLESDSCCASCVQTGCSCEGYQYYDCVNAGFKNGKVPEGESYFVDYGSTECSCPEGGGRISCHFISCPEIPANCIKVSEPADGCTECVRIGCVQGGQEYEAGHSFHMDPCQVCHCPTDGGKLMCYPVPDCDPHNVQKPMLATTTEDKAHQRHRNDPHAFRPQDRVDHFSEPYRVAHRDNLPLFLPALSHMDEEEEEEDEDYDYGPTDTPETHADDLALPTQSSISKRVISVSDPYKADRTSPYQGYYMPGKLELRQSYGVHEDTTDRVQVTGRTQGMNQVQETDGDGVLDILTVRGTDGGQGTHRVPGTNTVVGKVPETDADRVADKVQGTDKPQVTDRTHGTGKDTVTDRPHGTDKDTVTDRTHRTDKDTVTDRPHGTGKDMVTDRAHGTDKDTVTDRNRPKGPDRVTTQVTDRLVTVTVEQTTSQPRGDSTTPAPRRSEIQIPPQGTEDLIDTNEEEMAEEVEEEEAEEEEVEERVVTLKNVTKPEGEDVPYDIGVETQERNTPSGLVKPDGEQPVNHSERAIMVERSTKSPWKAEPYTLPTVRFSPTSQPPLRLKPDGGYPSKEQPQSLFNLHGEDTEEAEKEVEKEAKEEERRNIPVFLPKPEGGPGTSAKDLVEECCEVGQRWAAERNDCARMPLDKHPVCSVAQQQCCSGFLKENRCLAGMTAAREGGVCALNPGDQCTDDSYQVCCSCCALGLLLRGEGKGCDAHHYLGYPCGHIFLTCCEEEEGLGQPTPKKGEASRPTPKPKKVSNVDSNFPKEAFSIRDTDEAANSLEDQDVDECQRSRGQLCHHMCINTWGSYRCGCHQGYVLLQDGHSCAPESPEEDNQVREEDRPIRERPTPTAPPTSSPAHHNPCAGNGGCMQQCVVVAGHALCSCFPGFSLMADGHTCEDVNECVTDTHSCQASERCVNTLGSFVCERHVTCPPGRQLRKGVCEDIDECASGTHDCGVGFQCVNTEGSFLCNPKQKCLTGFTQDSHSNCIDVNECRSLSEPCSSGFNCINTVGSYTCQRKVIRCSQGYHTSPDGSKCLDVDECQTGIHHCGEGQICHNLPGSYRCDCQTGYQYDAIRQVCTDVNECWRYPGRLCAQTCENTPGSYKCSCTAGFTLAFDGKNCEDLNECDNNPCGQECANIYGSYQCYCRPGYYLKEDGHSCEDIDECSQSIGNLCAFQCVNVAGSYQCACPPQGYTMSANGRTCRDIDECTSGSHNCSYGQSCHNIQGGFRCLSFDCPQNYKKVSDTRCERTRCPASQDCQSAPLRITYYQLSFQTNIVIPAQIFRVGPSPAYSGDHIVISITRGNEEGYFSTRKLNGFTGAVYLQRQVREPKDFLIDVEMRLLRQGTFTSFLARIYVFITTNAL